MRIVSFGFKHTKLAPPGIIVDVRELHNPHHHPALRERDGRDEEVQQFVAASPKYVKLMNYAAEKAREGNDIVFGCHGGRHRSVACAEMLAEGLRAQGFKVEVEHTALPK